LPATECRLPTSLSSFFSFLKKGDHDTRAVIGSGQYRWLLAMLAEPMLLRISLDLPYQIW
jgi:hypothetical protein